MTKRVTARSRHSVEQALTLHKAGRLGEAEQIYRALLAADPHHFDALHLSGVLKHQQGRSVDALRLVAAALKAKPGSADALVSYGVILEALKRHEEALASFDRALAARAGDAALHYNRGNALKGLGRHAEALASYDRAHRTCARPCRRTPQSAAVPMRRLNETKRRSRVTIRCFR